MRIEQKPILEVLGTPDARFVIPVFQRVYSWSARQCEELWDDIMRAGHAGEPHFMGLLLCSHDADGWQGLEQLNVIDGQQRLTTLSLLLIALRKQWEEVEADAARVDDLTQRFLIANGAGAASPKLVLSGMDNATLAALAGAAEIPEAPAQRLIDNCLLFATKMEEDSFDQGAFWTGLGLLQVAFVMLDATDNPQLVFESLNSKGMPLSTGDRVRNLIIASTEGATQEHLYQELWLPLEERVAHAEPPATVTEVLQAWLAERYRSVHILDASEVYGLLKTRLRDEFDGSLERLLQAAGAYGEQYLGDADYRERAHKDAAAWIAGKPKNSISEYKLFGD